MTDNILIDEFLNNLNAIETMIARMKISAGQILGVISSPPPSAGIAAPTNPISDDSAQYLTFTASVIGATLAPTNQSIDDANQHITFTGSII